MLVRTQVVIVALATLALAIPAGFYSAVYGEIALGGCVGCPSDSTSIPALLARLVWLVITGMGLVGGVLLLLDRPWGVATARGFHGTVLGAFAVAIIWGLSSHEMFIVALVASPFIVLVALPSLYVLRVARKKQGADP